MKKWIAGTTRGTFWNLHPESPWFDTEEGALEWASKYLEEHPGIIQKGIEGFGPRLIETNDLPDQYRVKFGGDTPMPSEGFDTLTEARARANDVVLRRKAPYAAVERLSGGAWIAIETHVDRSQ